MIEEMIGGLIVAYILVAVLVLSLNVSTTRWRWWVKAGAITFTGVYFLGVAYFTHGLLGWATDDRLPERFQLLWGKVVEPEKYTGKEGFIYLWVEALDEFNLPSDIPRNYKVPYDDDLAQKVLEATGKIKQGIDVAGAPEILDPEDPPDEEDLAEAEQGDKDGGRYDVEVFPDEGLTIEFQDLPPPILPEKEVI